MPAVSQEYLEWRKFILPLSPSRFDLTGIPDEVYGVLMDAGMGAGPGQYLGISVYALNTGEASLKASPGAGVIGLGDIKEIVHQGQSLLQQTSAAPNFDYPEAHQIFFYFLTTSGVRLFACCLQDIKKGHPFYGMFMMFSTIKGFADRILDQQRVASH
jgi:hypothetical protein